MSGKTKDWMDALLAEHEKRREAKEREQRAEEREKEKFDALIDRYWQECIEAWTDRIDRYSARVADVDRLSVSKDGDGDNLKIAKGSSYPTASLDITLLRPFRLVTCSVEGEPSKKAKTCKVLAGDVGLRLEVWTPGATSGRAVEDVEEEFLKDFLTLLLLPKQRQP